MASESGVPCRCGNVNCLETLASPRAVVERARALAPESRGGGLARAPEAVTCDALARLARRASVSNGLAHNQIILGASTLILRDDSFPFRRQPRAPRGPRRGPPAAERGRRAS